MIDALTWDSNFFDLQIGRLNGFDQDYSASQLDEAIAYSKKHFDLTYFIINPKNTEAVAHLEQLGHAITDQKATFVKRLTAEDEYPIHPSIEPYTVDHVEEALLTLTLQSGEFSRYKTDQKLPANAYEKLYSKWIENSVNRQMADHVLVSKKDTALQGFITLSIRSSYSEIGLLAVDQKSRGEGISKKLIDQALYYSSINGSEYIRVVTQLNNKIACQLYQKKGFQLEKLEYIYHIWKK